MLVLPAPDVAGYLHLSNIQGRGTSYECETCFGQTICEDANCPAGYEQNQLGKGCNVDASPTFGFTNTDVQCKSTDINGGNACSPCAAGKYKAVDNKGTLTQAADGSWIRTPAASAKAWANADDENQCKCCASGKYQDQTAQKTCPTTDVTCPAGKTPPPSVHMASS